MGQETGAEEGIFSRHFRRLDLCRGSRSPRRPPRLGDPVHAARYRRTLPFVTDLRRHPRDMDEEERAISMSTPHYQMP